MNLHIYVSRSGSKLAQLPSLPLPPSSPSFSLIETDMASQRDIFMDSPGSSSSIQVSSSLPANLTYEYVWVILFEWNLDVEHPFELYQIGSFSTSELKPEWITGDLEDLSRLKKLTFSNLKGKTFSLFGKVEKCKLFTYLNY